VGCADDDLCDACVESRLAELRAIAARRGEEWADDIARKIHRSEPWPETPTMQAMARVRVADLTRDERLREQLAAEALAWAKRRWASGVRLLAQG
jgi:predicted GNAT family N-acyltransferase